MDYKEKYHAYLKSEEWAQIRIDLIELRDSRCDRCNVKRMNKYLHVHHLTYDRIFNEEPGDLELLCVQCHKAEHKKINLKSKRKLRSKKPVNKEIKQLIKLRMGGEITKHQYREIRKVYKKLA